ncbi:hypothetical protein BC830DRAFT_1165918 [Chytriomyces sp. MP71]|nr:hypothetical protein BC830DRAFT_1165918 [Chytriomyces sp. MP71]
MPTPPQIAAVAREVGSEYGKVKVWFQKRAVLKRRAGKADGSGSRKEADGGESSSGSEYKE